MRILSIIIIFFIHLGIFAQGNNEILFKLIDAQTNLPVPYATIQIKGTANGMVSNVDGGFRIPTLYKSREAVIVISCIGYSTKELPLQNVSSLQLNTILLQPKVEELEMVLIEGKKRPKKVTMSVDAIINLAVNRIRINYPKEDFSLIGYYRDYQVYNNRYYNLNEAVIETFDRGFDTDVMMHEDNQSAVYSYAPNDDFLRDSILLKTYDGKSKFIENTVLSGQGGNELGILKIHDPIRNFNQQSFSFIYNFEKRFAKNHDFTILRKVYVNDESLYEIAFKAKKHITKDYHKAKGRVYISENTFAIHKLEYQVFETEPEALLFEVTLEYKPFKEKMYLNYVTFNNRFKVSDDFKFDVDSIQYDKTEKAMFIKFNSPLNLSTVSKKDFRFKYLKKKLVVSDFEILNPQYLKINFLEWSIPTELETTEDMSQFDIKIRRIYDVSDRELYKSNKIEAYQFREFFVQKINVGRTLNKDLNIAEKYKPVSSAPLNGTLDVNEYWLNTPLKKVID